MSVVGTVSLETVVYDSVVDSVIVCGLLVATTYPRLAADAIAIISSIRRTPINRFTFLSAFPIVLLRRHFQVDILAVAKKEPLNCHIPSE